MAKVLVAEDDRITKRIIQRALEAQGHQIIDTADGKSAYRSTIAEQPDAVLLDVKMSVMDGFEVLRRLSKNPATREIPVVLMTGVPPEEGEQLGLKLGARHYITKPLLPATIQSAVRSVLRGAEAAEEPLPAEPPVSEEPEEPEEIDGELALGVGQEVIDVKLGGGVPPKSLALLEGTPAAGKSVLCQHLAYSAISKGLKVAYYTFEDSSQSLVSQMASLGMSVAEAVKAGSLDIHPLKHPTDGEDVDRRLGSLFQQWEDLPRGFSVVVVDALTTLATDASDRALINFFSNSRRLSKDGTTILLAVHASTFDAQMGVRIDAVTDVHLKLSSTRIKTRMVKSLEVIKMRNTALDTDNLLYFEVLPGLGMQLSPYRSVHI